jgi:hypothetical protein
MWKGFVCPVVTHFGTYLFSFYLKPNTEEVWNIPLNNGHFRIKETYLIYTLIICADELTSTLCTNVCAYSPIRVAAWSKLYVWSLVFVGIAGSNTAEGMKVGPLCLFCVMHVAPSLRRTDHSFRGVLPRVCVSNRVWSRNLKNRRPIRDFGCRVTGEKHIYTYMETF